MRRPARHATRRLLPLPLGRLLPRLRERLGPRLGGALRAGSRSLLSLAVGLVILALIGLLLANFVGQVMQSARLEARREQVAAEVDRIAAENAELAAAVAYAESDLNVERIAREQLGYARDGDIVLLPEIPAATPAPAVAPAPAAPPAPAAAPAPNWRRWWDAFFPPGA